MKTRIHLWSYVAQFFLEWKIFQSKFVEKINTHFMFNNFFLENRAVCEMMWKNTVEPGRPQMTIRCMRIICWITKVTNINSECVILTGFPLQQCLQESASVLYFTYVGCLVISYWKCRNRPNLGENLRT
jgi:hypothetical protein